MIRICLILSICFLSFSVVFAQSNETVSLLIPVPSNIGKFSKRLPPNRNRFIEKDNLKFEISVEPVNSPNNRKAIAVEIKTTYKELVFENIGGNETARLKFYGRITSKDKTTDGFFEEHLEELANVDDLVNGSNKQVVLRKVFELPDGIYQIGIIITDSASGMRGVKVKRFNVPLP